jgi:hypothetical protein
MTGGRLRHEAIERRKRWLAERDAFLAAQLESDEAVLARSRSGPFVTDRRILIGYRSPGPDRWVCPKITWSAAMPSARTTAAIDRRPARRSSTALRSGLSGPSPIWLSAASARDRRGP